MPHTISVLMVDDYPLLRDGVKATLAETEGISFVGFTGHTARAMEQIAILSPNILLYCSRATASLALGELKAIREQFPALKILVMADEEQVANAMASRAFGFLMARTPGAPIVGSERDGFPRLRCEGRYPEIRAPLLEEALRALGEGEVWLSPSLARRPPEESGELADLTVQERRALDLLARGWDVLTIAAELHLAPQTVRNYLSRVYGKLGVSSSAETIVWARKHGLGR